MLWKMAREYLIIRSIKNEDVTEILIEEKHRKILVKKKNV